MTSGTGDVRRRLAELDRLPAPDLWEEIEQRAPATTVETPAGGRRVRSLVAAAALAVIMAFAGGFWLSKVDSERGTVRVSNGGSATERSWSQVAAFPAEPENPGSAWLVAADDARIVAAFAGDRQIRVFNGGQLAAPTLLSTPPVAAVGTSEGVPIVLTQGGDLLVVDRNAIREIASLGRIEQSAELAVANGHVWVARGARAPLTVVDLGTGAVDEVDGVTGVDVIRAHAGRVWASSTASRRLVLLDALDRDVVAQRNLAGVVAIDPGADGDVWILRSNGVEGEVLHVNDEMKTTYRRVVPSTTTDIAITGNSLWTLDRGRLARTDLDDATPKQVTSIGATVGRLASGRDALFVFGTDVRVLRPNGSG
ncbi:MAG TPA: hypothetical protein VNC41_17270 [Acidimicrobiia bacterium]|nr:hypothetical protein [Acidimicrobiia bacterium]